MSTSARKSTTTPAAIAVRMTVVLSILVCIATTHLHQFADAATILDADVRIGYKPNMAISVVYDRSLSGFSVSEFTDDVEGALIDMDLKGRLTVLEVCGVNTDDYTEETKALATIVCSERTGSATSYVYVVVRFAFIHRDVANLGVGTTQIAFGNISGLIKTPTQMYTSHIYHYNSYQNAYPTVTQTIVHIAEENIVAAIIIIMFVVVGGVIATVGLVCYCRRNKEVKKGELGAARRAAGAGMGGVDLYEGGDAAVVSNNSSSVRSTNGGLRKPPPPPASNRSLNIPASSSNVREEDNDPIGSPIVSRGGGGTTHGSSYSNRRSDLDGDGDEEMGGFGTSDQRM